MTSQIFIDAKWKGNTKLSKETLNYLKDKKIKSIALFASVQFDLERVKKQLLDLKIKINITKAKRTSIEGQILGCDLYHDSFKEPIISQSDAVLYVGDGLFHPKALLLSQIKEKNFKEVLQWNPVNRKFSVLNKTTINKEIKRKIRNLKFYINAKKIGILVTIKPGQQYFNTSKKLKRKLNEDGKKAYIFIDDTIRLNELENYPFIEAWVNTACPRIGTDDILSTEKPLINLKEAINPIKELEELNKW